MRFYQEKIYQFEWFNQNGAGPLWCLGSSCIAAIDKKIFVSAWEQEKISNIWGRFHITPDTELISSI